MLGFKPVDSKYYHYIGTHFYLTYSDFIRYLVSHKIDLDDTGFMLIVFSVYKLMGSATLGAQLLVMFNAIVVTLSSYYVYRISKLLLNNSQSLFICFLWGIQFYASYTASVGLKENFMVLPIIMCFYHLTRLNRSFSTKQLLLSLLYSLFILLFRLPLFFMYLAALTFVFSLKFPYIRKYLGVAILAMFVVAYVYSYNTINTIALMRGYNYELLSMLTERKMHNAGAVAQIVNIISSIIGPIPNFIADKVKMNYITIFSFTSYLNMLASFYFVYGIIHIIKKKQVDYMPMLVFWLLNTFMLVFTFYSLHDRYQWPHVAFTFIVAGYGYNEWRSNKHLAKWDIYFLIVSTFLVLIFNGRF